MADRIKLVQGDTRPQLVLSLTDEKTGAPINLTGASVLMKFRELGAVTLKATLPAYPIAGIVLSDGSVSVAPPYDVFGAGGRLAMDWTAEALDSPGEFEGEIEVTFPGGAIQTPYEKLRFRIREQF